MPENPILETNYRTLSEWVKRSLSNEIDITASKHKQAKVFVVV